jgi:modified peptide precursor CbpA
MRKRAVSRSPFLLFFWFSEERIMTQNIQPQATVQTTATKAPPAAPTIAVRKSCNPDGIGLSHYVLMDKKAAK